MAAAEPRASAACRAIRPRLVIGPMPPPIHGYARAMQGLARRLDEAGAAPIILNLAASGAGLAYHLRRIMRVLATIAVLLRQIRLRGGGPVAHLGCDGGAGVLYTLALALAARTTGATLVLHHHSYARLHGRSFLLSLLMRCAGKNAVHVALRQPMAEDMRQAYGAGLRLRALSNAAFVAPGPPSHGDRPERPLTIGMIGNLCAAKGLDLFLDLADAIAATCPPCPVRALLAGPVDDTTGRHAVMARVAAGSLTWLGPLTPEDASARFYREVDLLMFPSSHVHEAEPFVILEALAHGVIPVATDRGCIRDLIADAGMIAPHGVGFVAAALAAVTRARRDPAWLAQLRRRARLRFLHEHEGALRDLKDLLANERRIDLAKSPPMRASGSSARRIQHDT